MTTNNPLAVAGRRITYTHPVTAAVLPGIITAIDEGILVRFRLDQHLVTLTRPDTSEALAFLEEMGTLPAPYPAGRFTPIPEELTGVYQRTPVYQAPTGDLIAVTDDHDAAVTALTAYRVASGWEPELVDLTGLEAAWVVFEWQPEGSEQPWLMTLAAEGDEQAIPVHRLPAPPMDDE